MATGSIAGSDSWYRALDRSQWKALLASNLGWVFDGYETYAIILVVGPALHRLLLPGQLSHLPVYAGLLIATTLLGWGVGGLIGGILTDYIGRKRMMIVSIAAYSILTGLSALSWSWGSFAALRFLVGIAIGSEWVTGTSMLTELWPDRARGKGVGLMQSGFGIGFFLASLIWLFVSFMGPDAWRVMFVVGILPALLTLWIRRAIPESALWERVRDRRREARERRRRGTPETPQDEDLTRFTLADLFAHPELRRRTLLAFLMSLTTTFGFWGISSWVPPYVGSLAGASGHSVPQWLGFAGLSYNVGSTIGYVALGFLADAWGRKPVTLLFFAMSLILIPIEFLATHNLGVLLALTCVLGCFASGQYTWMAVWLPELYPTRMRATAAGFVFNAPRLIAWVGPIISGTLIATFGGFSHAALVIGAIYILGLVTAPFLPETRGQPLPETV